jgi:hypothetical protein
MRHDAANSCSKDARTAQKLLTDKGMWPGAHLQLTYSPMLLNLAAFWK